MLFANICAANHCTRVGSIHYFFFTQYLSPKHFSTILVRIHFENFLDILNHIEILNKNVKLHLLSNAFGINGNGTDKKENEDVGC